MKLCLFDAFLHETKDLAKKCPSAPRSEILIVKVEIRNLYLIHTIHMYLIGQER